MRSDLRYALRLLRRTPAFTLPAAISLALGITLTTTIFGVVSATLLRPLSASGDGDLVRIGRSPRGQQQFRSASIDEFRYLRQHFSSLDGLAGEQMETLSLDAAEGPRPLAVEIVAGDYFAVAGAQPSRGRSFVADLPAAAEPIAVVSDRFWRRHFAADPEAIGRSIGINGVALTVVGVAPPGFLGTFPGVDVDVWLPAATATLVKHARSPEPSSLQLIGRLKHGVPLARARDELRMLGRQMAEQNPNRDPEREFVIAEARGVHPAFARILRIFLTLLMAVVAVVLLIACANVGSLMLARASTRRSEIAVRLACCASRGRIVRQLLVESVVLAAIGGTIGVLLSAWTLRLLNLYPIANGPTGAPLFFDFGLDGRVLLFAIAVTLLTTMGFGLAPALRGSRLDAWTSLSDRTSGLHRSRLRSALVVAQVALSSLLLVAAALLFRSLHNAGTLDLGFDPDAVTVAAFDVRSLGYDRSQIDAFHVELLRRVRVLHGIDAAALADFVPMDDPGGTLTVSSPAADRASMTIPYGLVSDGFFATLRQPLVRGRDFTAGDRAGASRVAIVNETMARQYWPGADPIGARLSLKGEAVFQVEIVGVMRDARYVSFGGSVGPLLVMPVLQHGGTALTLYTHSSIGSTAGKEIGQVARALAPRVPQNTRTLREAMATSLVPARLARLVIAIAGGVALLLATTGLYGLVYYTLEQRLKEIGIRLALGADRRRMLELIVGSAMRLSAIGVVLGVLAALGAARFLSALMYGLSAFDPLTLAAVSTAMLLISLTAALTGARRGLLVDPTSILRRD
jgi:putative ABC transport system permease protein